MLRFCWRALFVENLFSCQILFRAGFLLEPLLTAVAVDTFSPHIRKWELKNWKQCSSARFLHNGTWRNRSAANDSALLSLPYSAITPQVSVALLVSAPLASRCPFFSMLTRYRGACCTTNPSVLNFYLNAQFWIHLAAPCLKQKKVFSRGSCRIASFLLLNWGNVAELLGFWCCQLENWGNLAELLRFFQERLSEGFFQQWRSAIHLRMCTSSHPHMFKHSHLLIFT